MEISLNRLKNVNTINSITNNISAKVEVKEDTLKPFDLITWINKSQLRSGTPNEYLGIYNNYLNTWHANKGSTASEKQTGIKSLYKTLLKNVAINYSTDEERRWLRNIDLNDPADLDVAMPFFSSRLKEICLYFANQREEVKQQRLRYDLAGSVKGSKQLVVSDLITLVKRDDFILQYKSTKPSIDVVLEDFNIVVDELYDISQDYFDIPSTRVATVTGDRGDYYKFQQFTVDPLVFIDEDTSVKHLIESYDTELQSTDTSTILTSDLSELVADVSFTEEELTQLPDSEFINYIKTRENLNLVNEKNLPTEHGGVDMFYLSAGSSTSDFVSGSLFKSTKPYRNLHNRYNSTVNFFPDVGSMVSVKQLGRFFVPDNIGTANYFSLSPKPKVLTSELSAGQIYTFPDPDIYGTGLGTSKTANTAPIDHDETVSWTKADRSNEKFQGDIVNQVQLQKFYPYSSKEEESLEPQVGVSRVTDPVDFWTGEEKDIWANDDVYTPELQNTFDHDDRQDDLLVTDRSIYNWKTDIYGNEYSIYKNVSPLSLASLQEDTEYVCSTLDFKEFDNSETELSTVNFIDGGRVPGTDPLPENLNPSQSYVGGLSGFGAVDPVFDTVSYGANFLPDICPVPVETFICENLDGGVYGYSVDSYSASNSGLNFNQVDDDITFPDTFYFNTKHCDEDGERDYTYSIESDVPLYKPNPAATNSQLVSSVNTFTSLNTVFEESSAGGLIEFRNKYGIGRGSPLIEAFSAVFDRYENDATLSYIYDDVKNNNIVDIDIIYDILVLYGSDYILFEKINFDYDTGTIQPSTLNNAIIKTSGAKLERTIPLFFNEDKKYILCGRMREIVDCNACYPQFIKLDIETLQLSTEFPNTSAEQLQFKLPSNLYQYTITDLEDIKLSYNNTLDKYNITYFGSISGHEAGVPAVSGIKVLFSHDFRYILNNMELTDASVFHTDAIENIPQSISKDISEYTVSLENGASNVNLATSIGHSLSAYEFTLTVNARSLTAGDYSFTKFIYDFGDGSELVEKQRDILWDDPSTLGTQDLDELLKLLGPDWGDPKAFTPEHTYYFNNQTQTLTATVSAVHNNFDVDTYKIVIDTAPYSIKSSVDDIKLVDTQYYTDSNNVEKILLTLETQSPKRIAMATLQKNLNEENNLPDLTDLTYTYTLVQGEGDDHNNLFYIQENSDGSQELKAKYSLSAGEYSVRIRSTDELDAYTEKVFIVIIERDMC